MSQLKETHQSELKNTDSLKQSIFKLLKHFDLPDYIKLKSPSDVDDAISVICKELH